MVVTNDEIVLTPRGKEFLLEYEKSLILNSMV